MPPFFDLKLLCKFCRTGSDLGCLSRLHHVHPRWRLDGEFVGLVLGHTDFPLLWVGSGMMLLRILKIASSISASG